jgi:hypothetical protein
LSASNIRQEERIIQGLTENVEIIENAQIESESVTLNSHAEIEKNKEETIKKIKKLFLNKRVLVWILSSLICGQIGSTLPWGVIFSQLSSQNNSQSVPVFNTVSQPEDIVRIRDVWDLILKNIKVK